MLNPNKDSNSTSSLRTHSSNCYLNNTDYFSVCLNKSKACNSDVSYVYSEIRLFDKKKLTIP